MIERNIPSSPPDITDSEISEVIDALRSGRITTGVGVILTTGFGFDLSKNTLQYSIFCGNLHKLVA